MCTPRVLEDGDEGRIRCLCGGNWVLTAAVLTHSWVNMEYLMQECMVGMLVRG
jgi:hypothetical protein